MAPSSTDRNKSPQKAAEIMRVVRFMPDETVASTAFVPGPGHNMFLGRNAAELPMGKHMIDR
jgi:hypothetical protein